METTKQQAEAKIRDLLDDAFSGARVFQGGGNELLGADLQEMILEGANASLDRLYPNFHLSDHAGWSKVYDKAKAGAPDALVAVGDEGEPARNSVCKAVLGAIAGGKKGIELREELEGPKYGWSGDAVDGAIMVLLVAGLIEAKVGNEAVDFRQLERKSIGKALFKVQSATISTAERIQIRKVLQKAGLNFKQGEEAVHVPAFLQKLYTLAEKAGGEPPRPETPDTSVLDSIRTTTGNEQLMLIHTQRDFLKEALEQWSDLASKIEERTQQWHTLKLLNNAASGLADAALYKVQVDSIESGRQLLQAPDPVKPLIANLTDLLRGELNRLKADYERLHAAGMQRLEADDNWTKLEPEQKNQLLADQRLTLAAMPEINVGSTEQVLQTLRGISLSALEDRVAAMNGRFNDVAMEAAALMEPKAKRVYLSRPTLKFRADLDAWLTKAEAELSKALQDGPVIIQ